LVFQSYRLHRLVHLNASPAQIFNAGFGSVLLLLNTAHRHSDFGALSPFLLPTFLNPPALPTHYLKRLLNSVAAKDGFLFKRPNTFLFFDYPMRWAQPSTESIIRILLCGRYTDFASIRHEFIARVRGMSN
jgi:hypothetical protein